MESVALIVAPVDDILHAVIQVGLDAGTPEFCLEFRVDLGNELGLIGPHETRRDIVRKGLTERYARIYRPVLFRKSRAAAEQAENSRQDSNGLPMQAAEPDVGKAWMRYT
jgi:hypothetical protein